jgi:Protein of unknown function (DUF1064)
MWAMSKMLRMSEEEYAKRTKALANRALCKQVQKDGPSLPPKRSKYGNRKVYFDRIIFDSAGECDRYMTLRELVRQGAICDLVVHPYFALHTIEGGIVGVFRPDFRFLERPYGSGVAVPWTEVIEDFKSPVTAKHPSFLRNCRHLLDEYGLIVRVVLK